jgi:hypothetical protein
MYIDTTVRLSSSNDCRIQNIARSSHFLRYKTLTQILGLLKLPQEADRIYDYAR